MREIFSFIFDRLIDPLELPIEPWKEWIILFVIGWIAYLVAFRLVGDMYNAGDISTGIGGSFFHWLIRLVVFVIMWAITNEVIRIWQFCAAHWIAVVGIAGGLFVSGIIVGVVIHNLRGGTRSA